MYIYIYIYVLQGLRRDNGKEHGDYYFMMGYMSISAYILGLE